MRFYIIAGEASGDLHASNLVYALRGAAPDSVFRGWGGDLMEAQGVELVKHYRDLAFMGFMEVAAHLPTILKNFRFCEEDLERWKPNVLILVDYPGFNLRMARFAHSRGLKVFYYISPQLWAWNASRVSKVKKFVDRMFVILPFETEFYAHYDYRVDFCGHPLLDVINDSMERPSRSAFLERNDLPDRPIVALLPGSRRMEIGKMLKEMLSVRASFPEYQFIVAAAPSMPEEHYAEFLSGTDVRVVSGQTYALLNHSEAALVTSGTATLETALLGVPEVVCYRGNALSYLIARQLVKVKYISLVNLICDRPVVPELIQNDLNPANLSAALSKALTDTAYREELAEQYKELRQRLGGPGASDRVAGLMVQYLTRP